jgi:hypothetical protein
MYIYNLLQKVLLGRQLVPERLLLPPAPTSPVKKKSRQLVTKNEKKILLPRSPEWKQENIKKKTLKSDLTCCRAVIYETFSYCCILP